MIHGAEIDIESAVGGDELAAALDAAIAGSPFRVAAVRPAGPDRQRCSFRVRTAGLAVGYGNILDLQHRVARQFEIVRVERCAALAG